MYNPFGRPVDELVETDLMDILPDKCENWTYEYKGADKLADGGGIARSIASFANSYGGWLFIGIEADAENKPQLPFEGISSDEQCLTERIYQMCNSHLSPAPYLVCHAVRLQSGNSVLVVHVPQSPNPPHILMRTGSVFERTGNTTKPSDMVRDRQKLDRLYDRARENSQKVEGLLAVHQSGGLFLDAMAAEIRSHDRLADRPFAAFSLIAYPEVALEALIGFESPIAPPIVIANSVFNGAGEPARTWSYHVAREGRIRWLDHNRCLRIGDTLFYVDRFGHIGYGEVAGGTSAIFRPEAQMVTRCVESLPGFGAAAQFVYRKNGYFGAVNLVCRILLSDGSHRPALQISASASDLPDVIAANKQSINADLCRLAGLADS